MSVLSAAVPDKQRREELLRQRESRSDLCMSLALLPIAFLIAVRLAAGHNSADFLKDAYTKRVFIRDEAEQVLDRTEETHQKRAFLDGV